MYRSFAAAAALAAAVFIYAAVFPSHAAAQQKQIPPESNGHAAVAEIVLPPEMEMEKPATLAAIDSDGMLVEGVIISLPGGRKVTTDATGPRAICCHPRTRRIYCRSCPPARFSRECAQYSSLVVARIPQQILPDLQFRNTPHILVHGQSETVMGYGFRGDAESDGATVGGKTALVLAASPMGLSFKPPEVPTWGQRVWC